MDAGAVGIAVAKVSEAEKLAESMAETMAMDTPLDITVAYPVLGRIALKRSPPWPGSIPSGWRWTPNT